jgi:hypothetical protein
MRKHRIKASGDRLGVPEAIRRILAGHTLVFLLLGDDYLLSARPPLVPADGQKFIAFGSPRLRRVPGSDVVIVPAEREAAREFHDGITTVKGKMFFLLAKGLVHDPSMWADLRPDSRNSPVADEDWEPDYMSRRDDLNEFYRLLDELRHRVGGAECSVIATERAAGLNVACTSSLKMESSVPMV